MYWTFLKMWIFLHVSINIFIYFIVEKIGPVDLQLKSIFFQTCANILIPSKFYLPPGSNLRIFVVQNHIHMQSAMIRVQSGSIRLMSGSRSCADWIRAMCFMEQVMYFSGLRVYILMYNLDQDTFFSGLIISCVVWISFKCRLDQFHVLSGSVSCVVWIIFLSCLDYFNVQSGFTSMLYGSFSEQVPCSVWIMCSLDHVHAF